ncbi:TetR/AcrR family transcriptional regulator C-terminal domain-containing protein [Actinomadura macrotermitis]|uniref:TetR/AcrR family transcriptional regulator C-terminal domain-containing protein n=1 Tax=Actinomadura macrotermitis TaxID=2585200 RepID=UPI0018868761
MAGRGQGTSDDDHDVVAVVLHRLHQRAHGLLAEVLGDLRARRRLPIADTEMAVIQFFGLTVYPHLITGSFGTSLPEDRTARLIDNGVDMFLKTYGTPK